MPDDASLDDFVGGGSDDGSDADSADEDAVDADASSAAGASAETVSPATATAVWTPDGEACAACETVVAFRWRDDEAMVCAECKEW